MDLVKDKILDILKNSNRINSIIQTLKLINTENLMLTGGSLRNVVWNYLHYFTEEYELEDCDIIFYNTMNLSKNYENSIKKKLEHLNPKIKWSVKNQARMHIRNKHKPYDGIPNALASFPETCSAIAIDSNWHIIAPCGLEDWFNLIVTPTTFCSKNEIEVFHKRIKQKRWLEKWADLQIKTGNICNVFDKIEVSLY